MRLHVRAGVDFEFGLLALRFPKCIIISPPDFVVCWLAMFVCVCVVFVCLIVLAHVSCLF